MFLKNATGRVETMKTGPNDTSGVAWALGAFFIFLQYFLILIDVFKIYTDSLKGRLVYAMRSNGPHPQVFVLKKEKR